MINSKVISHPLIHTITPAIGTKVITQPSPKIIIPVSKPAIKEINIITAQKQPTIINVLEDSIQECMNAGSLNLAARAKFHKILDKALPDIMKDENFINKGRASKVYKISDNYVAKIKRGKTANNAIHFFNPTMCPSEQFSHLDFYYGEPLIRVGNVEILKNATPTSDFMKCGTGYKTINTCNGPEMRCKHEDLSDYYNKYLPLCASLPQESFDNFAKGLQKLNGITSRDALMRKVYYTPDTINPNNILIADKEFRVVDNLEPIHIAKNPNSLYTMLEPLVIKLAPETYAGELDDRPKEMLPFTRTIIKKSLIAAEKTGLAIDPQEIDRSKIKSAREAFEADQIKSEHADWYLSKTYSDNQTHFPFLKLTKQLSDMRKSGTSIADRLGYIDEQLKI